MNKEEKGKEKKKEEKVNKMRQDNHLFSFTFSDWFEFPFWFFIILTSCLSDFRDLRHSSNNFSIDLFG